MTPSQYITKARSFLRHFDDTKIQRAWVGTYLAEETGELARELRPWLLGQPIDRERCIDEAGDVCWALACLTRYDLTFEVDNYKWLSAIDILNRLERRHPSGLIACVRDLCHVTIEEIMDCNIAKLEARRGTPKDKQA